MRKLATSVLSIAAAFTVVGAAPAFAATGNGGTGPDNIHHAGVTLDQMAIDGYVITGINGDPSLVSVNFANGRDYSSVGALLGPDYAALAYSKSSGTVFEYGQIVADDAGITVYADRFDYASLDEVGPAEVDTE